jgi:phosphoribosylamine--glycine ligase
MHRLESDFLEALMQAARGHLDGTRLQWKPEPSVCVVLASGGYPGNFEIGKEITGLEEAEELGATVFQAGTYWRADHLETAGGRVLGVTASGADLPAAIEAAYAGVRKIHFAGMHYRTDIGRKGLKRYNVGSPGT